MANLQEQYSNQKILVRGTRNLITKQRILMQSAGSPEMLCGNFSEVAEYLLNLTGAKVCWKLDSYVAPILAMLPLETLEALYRTGTTEIGDYVIYYNTGKSFNIKKGKKWASVYWIEQYYEGEPEPSTLEELEAKAKGLLMELAAIGVYPKRLTSAVSMFQDVFNKIPLPTWRDMPDKASEWAWACAGSAWTEAHKLGHFPVAYDYDLSSAFPSVIATLLDTRYGAWVRSYKIPPDDAVYGVGYGTVRVSSDLSPILFHASDNRFYSPKGVWERPLMLQHIRWLKESGSGDFTSSEGYYWIPKTKVYPLQLSMHKMFGHRQLSPMLNKVVKRAMNGLYGKFLEVRKGGIFGERFNPIWGGTIETEVGIKVAQFLLEKGAGSSLVHISTDGVLLDSCVPITESKRMGGWRLDSVGSALVVSSGVLFYGDKRPNQINYQEAMEMLQSDPTNYEWGKRFQRRMTLGDQIEYHLPIGTMREVSTSFGLATQHDREFKRIPTNGKDLLDNVFTSTALSVNKLRAYKE